MLATLCVAVASGAPQPARSFTRARASERADSCTQIRAGNTRLLQLHTDASLRNDHTALNDHNGIIDAGWQLGVLYRRANKELRAYELGSPRALGYLRESSARGGSDEDAALLHDVVRAIVEWRPSYVQPHLVGSVRTMHAVVRAFANSTRSDERFAVRTLRCSLCDEALWDTRASKIDLILFAQDQLGIRTPWTRLVPAAGLDARALAQASALLPLVIKSNRDGGGGDVAICQNARCMRLALEGYASRASACVLQQYVDGPTLVYDGTALDGQLLGGFSRFEVLSQGRRGAGMLFETIESSELERVAERLVRRLGYTGYMNLEFVLAPDGEPLLIDPNMRESTAFGYDSGAIGMGDGVLVRLRKAVSGEVALAHNARAWRSALPHSVTLKRFEHGGGLCTAKLCKLALAYCPTVYVPFPHHLAHYVRTFSPGTAELAAETDERGACTYVSPRFFPGVPVRQMCGRRETACNRATEPPACRPLVVTTPPFTLADVVAWRLCDPDRLWRAYAHCPQRARARAECGDGADGVGGGARRCAPFALGARDDGYWASIGLSACRGVSRPPPPNATVSVGVAAAPQPAVPARATVEYARGFAFTQSEPPAFV
ncbi:hypothetical protein KFE25_003581 [Diacronema lutheri]|uniref:ATP-grasp domain-containing protein n=1 Tax=Diacronema lutheri TaxID=2081491 RepID=A0A8J5X1C9_DIALT|nr:hypothetical protein KFE25_003581 [Diacronema lutheri]